MPTPIYPIALFLLASPVVAQHCPWGVVSSEAGSSERFGHRLDLDGSRAAIAAPRESRDAGRGGAIFVFEQHPTSRAWFETAALFPGMPLPFSEFGRQLALDGDVIAGARGQLNSADEVIVFERSPATDAWAEVQTLFASDSGPNDEFGSGIAIDGSRMLVGGYRGNSDRGALYFFVRDPQTGTWSEVQFLVDAIQGGAPRLGWSVDLDGDRAVAGAPFALIGGTVLRGGLAVVYERDPQSGLWAEVQVLQASDAANNLQFGHSVALAGDLLVVGDRRNNPGGVTNAGAAYVFERDQVTGLWNEVDKLIASDADSGDEFGSAVATDGVEILVGAPEDDEVSSNAGAFYVFVPDPITGAWSEVEKTLPPSPEFAGRFGVAVASAGSTRVSGAFFGTSGSIPTGRAAFFMADSPDCDANGQGDLCDLFVGLSQDVDADGVPDACELLGSALCSPAVPNSSGLPSRAIVLGSGDVADNDVILATLDLPPSTVGYFLTSRSTGFVANPGGSAGDLCIAGPAVGRYAGDVLSSGSVLSVTLRIDLTEMPSPTGNVIAQPGETWYFQFWHRDFLGGVTSNFSDARCVTWQ